MIPARGTPSKGVFRADRAVVLAATGKQRSPATEAKRLITISEKSASGYAQNAKKHATDFRCAV